MQRLINTCVFVLLVLTFSPPTPALAIDGFGNLNDEFSYDDMRIERKKKKCAIFATVTNESKEFKNRVYITIYAFDNFDALKWKTRFTIDGISPGAERKIEGTISDCDGYYNPYKMKFDVKSK